MELDTGTVTVAAFLVQAVGFVAVPIWVVARVRGEVRELSAGLDGTNKRLDDLRDDVKDLQNAILQQRGGGA